METKYPALDNESGFSALWYRPDGDILMPANVALAPRPVDAIALVVPPDNRVLITNPSARASVLVEATPVARPDTTQVLEWRVDYERDQAQAFRALPVAGCLTEFAALADAGPAEAPQRVLDFVRRRGVLGLWPQPEYEPDGREVVRGRYRMRYVEPVSLYMRLAALVRYMLDAVKLVNGRKNITENSIAKLWEIDSDEGRGYVQVYLKGSQMQPTPFLYAGIVSLAENWAHVAALKLRLATGWAAQAPLRVDHGAWADGIGWDVDAIERMKPARVGELARVAGRRSHFAQMPAFLPHPSQRPSPLFNVLTLQLLQLVALPPGYYICAGCGHSFKWVPERPNSRRPQAGRGTFCSTSREKCKQKQTDRYNAAYYRETTKSRKAQRKAVSDFSDTAP